MAEFFTEVQQLKKKLPDIREFCCLWGWRCFGSAYAFGFGASHHLPDINDRLRRLDIWRVSLRRQAMREQEFVQAGIFPNVIAKDIGTRGGGACFTTAAKRDALERGQV